MAALLLLVTAAAAASLGDVARRDTGDIFTLIGSECGPAQCAEHGGALTVVRDTATGGCACACPQRAPLFREDRELCVDDLPECSLATFGTGTGMQRIPFVYLPLKGQIIHPSREITFQNVKTPVCAVSGAQFLTRKGFFDLRNTLDADVPFSLFRDEGRTFLQWSGEDELRARMSGRVMVVRLLCRDISSPPTSPLDLRGVFTPCVAFRVQGTPPRNSNNITEVTFASNAHTFETSGTSGLSVTEYIAIGISSLLLGLIYVASVFLYLHMKRRRKASAQNAKLKATRNKDGATITEHDIIRISNERVQILPNGLSPDEGIIKKNPLLTVGRQFHDNKGFSSDFSDSEDFPDSSLHSEDNTINKQTTSVVVHRQLKEVRQQGDGFEINHRDEPSIERLPDEHVSIVETIDDREIARPVGTTRRKLYFNPAYFEPHLMHDPPAAAIEFLSKIREVIAIAKQKMAAKRFHPILNLIPEEETYLSYVNSTNNYNGLGSQRSDSIVSLKRENSRKRSNCLGCPGCKTNNRHNDMKNVIKYNISTCSNCLGDKGDKQHTIQKWLENIPKIKQQVFYNDHSSESIQQNKNSHITQENNDSPCKIHKRNSFCTSYSTQLAGNNNSLRSTTRSVRSEPSGKNCDMLLPEFNGLEPNTETYEQVSCLCNVPVNSNEYESGCLQASADISFKRNKSSIKNKNALPDMVNEAIALDNFSRSSYNISSSDDEKLCKTVDSKVNDGYSRNISESPSGNEYETDSLERNSNKKRKTTPIDYPDVPSSQASPSLSTALPLEEELTIRNAIYKSNSSGNSLTPSPEGAICVEEDHYETIDIKKTDSSNVESTLKTNNSYSLVSEVYVNNNYNFDSTPTSPSGSECSMGSRKLFTLNNVEEKPGCLTIEVKDSPENYIRIHESDGFEPDTLDRKHPKHKEIIENMQFSRKELLDNIDNTEHKRQRIQLRSSGTFTKNSKIEQINKFNSLRNENDYQKQLLNRPKLSSEIYSGSKSLEETTDDNWDDNNGWSFEDGRLLTLELRHSKRQRQITPPTIKQLKILARPDILPPLPPTEDNTIYEKPTNPPRRVPSDSVSVEKRNSCRSLSPKKSDVCGNLSQCSTASVPSCSAIRGQIHLQCAEYEDVNIIINSKNETTNLENGRNCIRTSSCRSNGINTNTFVRGLKVEHRTKFRRKKGSNIEDSGYLSSDSTSSKLFQPKLVIAKIPSCSESDGTEDEARSESGAESVETHSVYFGNCQKQQSDESKIRNFKMSRNSSINLKGRNDSNKSQ